MLGELGSEYALRGQWRPAEALLARALRFGDSVALRCQLAHVLLAQHKHAACQSQLEAAERLPGQVCAPRDRRRPCSNAPGLGQAAPIPRSMGRPPRPSCTAELQDEEELRLVSQAWEALRLEWPVL